MKVNTKVVPVAAVVLVGGVAAALPLAHFVSWGAEQPYTGSKHPNVSYVVERVTDGDTIVVQQGTAQPITVRALGMDAPEIHDPHGAVQCFGPEASAYADRTLGRQRVTLSYDATAGRKDPNGRTLAYIWLGQKLYNQLAIEQGYARQYTDDRGHPYQRQAAFTAAEADARAHHRGLWAAATCNGTRKPVDNTNSKTLPPARSR